MTFDDAVSLLRRRDYLVVAETGEGGGQWRVGTVVKTGPELIAMAEREARLMQPAEPAPPATLPEPPPRKMRATRSKRRRLATVGHASGVRDVLEMLADLTRVVDRLERERD